MRYHHGHFAYQALFHLCIRSYANHLCSTCGAGSCWGRVPRLCALIRSTRICLFAHEYKQGCLCYVVGGWRQVSGWFRGFACALYFVLTDSARRTPRANPVPAVIKSKTACGMTTVAKSKCVATGSRFWTTMITTRIAKIAAVMIFTLRIKSKKGPQDYSA